ncbi:MAG TPA: hypothetical protein VIW93_14330 [Candidatus Acidoferrum sp.]
MFLVLVPSARSQEPPLPAGAIAQAARSLREQKPNSTKHPKTITNDDLPMQYSAPSASVSSPEPASTKVAEATKPAECDNEDANRLKADLLAAQEEQDQIRRELSYHPKVISDGDVDMTNFKPGSSGFNVGSPALLQSQPQAPARVTEVIVDEKIASLKRALLIRCQSPKDAEVQASLDQAEQDLKLLQRQFALDQNAFYSSPSYSGDAAGKARLDAEQQQIHSLQSEIEGMKSELEASKANPSVK